MSKQRVVISGILPCIDGGLVPIKRVVGETVEVEVDLVADGHDVLGGQLLYRKEGSLTWCATPLTPRINDRYRASFVVDELGRWEYQVEGWVDEIASWRLALDRKVAGAEHSDVAMHLRQGARLFKALGARAGGEERARWDTAAKQLDQADSAPDLARSVALDPVLAEAAKSFPNLQAATRSERPLRVQVEPRRALYSSWYEFFPRSCGEPGVHGTLRDAEARLVYAAQMGFDVVYLPPIHPNGTTHRKGKNNAVTAKPGEPGSPWAIGSAQGGHKAVHPDLGTLADLRAFVARAKELDVEVALDIAFQCSPDHPYVTEHPDWFVQRPDGSIQYAENPPKKYQDIYPIHFECEDAEALWQELLSVFLFWVEQGVTVFRVDNPHTKSLAFWRWCIEALKQVHPEVILLAEAFTRPKLMYALAKFGFSQSYTYFTWRNTPRELRQYMTELTQTELVEYFRPNLWPNTPDILPEHLQYGGRPAYIARLVLAATLGASYGIYGPAFELMDSESRPGSGENLDSEKYELKSWNVDRNDSLQALIRRMNQIREENPALQQLRSLCFHDCDNDTLLAYTKQAADDVVLVVVNMDFHHTQSGFVTLDLETLGIDPVGTYQVHDLLGGGRFIWSGARNYVQLDPETNPAHVFRIRRHVRTEQDFDYFA